MFLSNEVWELLKAELTSKDQQLRKAHERIDRLTESLAAKQHIPLIMPQAELPRFQPAVILEKGSGYFDMKPILPNNSASGAKPT
jgi:hypothetical protein